MTRLFIAIAFFVMFAIECRAQAPMAVLKKFRQVVNLIKQDQATELAAMVEYPLKRENPLPDITSPKAFSSYYKTLIDKNFKQKIAHYNDTDVFEHHGAYGLVGGSFDGDIWIDENGKILSVNYSSKSEQQLKAQLTKKIKSRIYPTINKWTDNVLVCMSAKLIVRVDQTDKGLRYVSWSKGHNMAEKPDLVLYIGVEEAQGTMGGWTWTFTNGDWKYVVDDVEMCENDANCGWFLRLFFKGINKGTTKLKTIK